MSTVISSLKTTFSNPDDMFDIALIAGFLVALYANIAYLFG